MMRTLLPALPPRPVMAFAALAGLAVLTRLPISPDVSAQQPQQPSDVTVAIVGDRSSPPRLAVVDFLALTNDAETRDAAATLSKVLADDLNFEHEFSLMPRDIVATIPPPTTALEIALDRWKEVNADGVLIGAVQKNGTTLRIQVRLYNVRTGVSVFSQEYTGAIASRRLIAHSVADEIHQQQRNLRGVARSKLTFNSDRDGERMTGTVEARGVREIYIADYDGENQRRVTVQRSLNINSIWSPDGRSIAYTSYRRGPPNIFVSHIYEGKLDELTKGPSVGQNVLPSWSPDGTRIAFASSRDGNFEIYVANRDGSNPRRLTNHPSIDTTPTWAPSGTQIAFTSDRGGTPQIYVVGIDGTGLRQLTREAYADRPTWSPAPYNEIAYAACNGRSCDLKILEIASGTVRQLTFGEGSNESPSFSANGRHIAFMSTRAGKPQIFTMARDGRDVKQITRIGENRQPDWSKYSRRRSGETQPCDDPFFRALCSLLS